MGAGIAAAGEAQRSAYRHALDLRLRALLGEGPRGEACLPGGGWMGEGAGARGGRRREMTRPAMMPPPLSLSLSPPGGLARSLLERPPNTPVIASGESAVRPNQRPDRIRERPRFPSGTIKTVPAPCAPPLPPSSQGRPLHPDPRRSCLLSPLALRGAPTEKQRASRRVEVGSTAPPAVHLSTPAHVTCIRLPLSGLPAPLAPGWWSFGVRYISGCISRQSAPSAPRRRPSGCCPPWKGREHRLGHARHPGSG